VTFIVEPNRSIIRAPYPAVRVIESVGAIGSHTGNSNLTSMHTVTIPGGLMGPNGVLRWWLGITLDAAATANYTVLVRNGASNFQAYQNKTVDAYTGRALFNQNDEKSQVSRRRYGVDMESTATAVEAWTIDTTHDWDIELTVQLNAADIGRTITLYGWILELLSTDK